NPITATTVNATATPPAICPRDSELALTRTIAVAPVAAARRSGSEAPICRCASLSIAVHQIIMTAAKATTEVQNAAGANVCARGLERRNVAAVRTTAAGIPSASQSL